jgi:delta(3,5)-delta(2,4)-dienoyl-CoA isomerase
MSLACDIRLSTANTKFSVKEVDIGLAADIGTLSRLPRAVGNQSWVKDVAMSARIFGSEEALRVGLVSGVYKDKSEAVAEVCILCFFNHPLLHTFAVLRYTDNVGWNVC